MDTEWMLAEITRFIDAYEGTAVGCSVRNMVENAADLTDYDTVLDIYGYI